MEVLLMYMKTTPSLYQRTLFKTTWLIMGVLFLHRLTTSPFQTTHFREALLVMLEVLYTYTNTTISLSLMLKFRTTLLAMELLFMHSLTMC